MTLYPNKPSCNPGLGVVRLILQREVVFQSVPVRGLWAACAGWSPEQWFAHLPQSDNQWKSSSFVYILAAATTSQRAFGSTELNTWPVLSNLCVYQRTYNGWRAPADVGLRLCGQWLGVNVCGTCDVMYPCIWLNDASGLRAFTPCAGGSTTYPRLLYTIV